MLASHRGSRLPPKRDSTTAAAVVTNEGETASPLGRLSRLEKVHGRFGLDASLLDSWTFAIPSREVDSSRTQFSASWGELPFKQTRQPLFVRRDDQLPPTAYVSTKIGEPEGIDIIHGLKRVVE